MLIPGSISRIFIIFLNKNHYNDLIKRKIGNDKLCVSGFSGAIKITIFVNFVAKDHVVVS